MKIDVLTLFPSLFESFVSHSIMKRAIEKKLVMFQAHDLREFTHDRHRTCDDKPYGGGPGMLMKPEPIFEAVETLFKKKKFSGKTRFVYMTPQGKKLDQKLVRDLSKAEELVILCGHYEGIDQRVIDKLVTDEISIGDYVLTGGELPAMVLVDAVTRYVPKVIGNEAFKEFESFSGNLLEYPQYTRPPEIRGLKVPAVLLSGNHKAIEDWRKKEAVRKTTQRRPDLLKFQAKKRKHKEK